MNPLDAQEWMNPLFQLTISSLKKSPGFSWNSFSCSRSDSGTEKMSKMPFRDYVELLYRAYLVDQGIVARLRDQLQDSEFLKDLESDPLVQDWQSINPRSVGPGIQQKSTYYPNPVNPQEGVRVFEDRRRIKTQKIIEACKRARR